MDQEVCVALNSDHGPRNDKVMRLYVKQGRTARQVGVPMEGGTRDEIEAAVARAKATGAMTAARTIADDRTGVPWNQSAFIAAVIDRSDAAALVAGVCGNDEFADVSRRSNSATTAASAS